MSHAGSLIVTREGEPAVPTAVLKDLHTLDERFGAKWHAATKCFAVTLRWAQGAPQWAFVQKGEIPLSQAHEIVAWLPVDVPIDQAPGFVRQQLADAARFRGDLRRMIDAQEAALAAQNASALADKASQVLEDSLIDASRAKTIDVGARRTRVVIPKAPKGKAA